MAATTATGATPEGQEGDLHKNTLELAKKMVKECFTKKQLDEMLDYEVYELDNGEKVQFEIWTEPCEGLALTWKDELIIDNEELYSLVHEGDTQKNAEYRYFKHVDGTIIRLPAKEIEKVYDLSPFSYFDEDGEKCGFFDDETGDGDTLVVQDDEEVKVSEVSEEIEVFRYWDGHNWKKIYLVPGQYDELELIELETEEYSTINMKGHFNLSYDHIEAVKFGQDKYAIILSYRSCSNDEVIFITQEEYDEIMKCECTSEVFDVLENYDL